MKQKTLRVVTIAMVRSILASSWKFQYLQKPTYNPVKHLWWSFYCKSSKPLTVFAKNLIIDSRLDSKYASVFTWRLFKLFFLQTFAAFYFFKFIKRAANHLILNNLNLLSLFISFTKTKLLLNNLLMNYKLE